ncbi:extensin [Pseudorhizobium endolithicum]|uniref:Extensin n=1 Tax=Pseudorhizobium endolithicum TaxID=1191678 RepID=A0ABM8PEH6_9HYPH|nr:extensin family protein [Pseudorhizobium endolithicum]CAD7024494.1 extensin [Pseudorhizobium endolithicum]
MQRLPVILLLALPLLTAAALPRTGPVPAPKPAVEDERQDGTAAPGKTAEAPPPGAATVPTPEPKPKTKAPAAPSRAPEEPSDAQSAGSPAEEGAGGKTPPVTADGKEEQAEPAREEPEKEAEQNGEESTEPAKESEEPPPPPPVAKEDPEALKACLANLATLGTKYDTAAPIDDGDGCGIDQPLEVTEVLPGIDTGGAQMRCETARALAHWLKDTVKPALDIAMPGRKITGLTTGSTYACRLRNGASTGEISEHARGNAIDIAAFRLDDGTEITMKPRDEDGTMEGAFQRTATAGACLHFTTVLSPGSDAAHQDHLHLDVLERESGYRYCR